MSAIPSSRPRRSGSSSFSWKYLSVVADMYLLPAILAVLVLTDLFTGLNWALSPAADLASPSYATAKLLAPMAAYGWLFLVAGALNTCLLAATPVPAWWRGYAVFMTGCLWAFWAVLFGWAATGPHASWQGTITATSFALLHWVAGFAVSHRSRG